MWYPTLSDALDIYERVATHEGHRPDISDPAALDRVIVAPQRHGTDQATAESLSRKAAAMCVMAVQTQVFGSITSRTAYVLISEFLDRNGANFNASVADLKEQSYPIADGTVGMEIASWIEAHLEMREPHRHQRHILTALNRLAQTIEELEGVPGLERKVETLDNVGDGVCRAMASLFRSEMKGEEIVHGSFPAVHDRWGPVFE